MKTKSRGSIYRAEALPGFLQLTEHEQLALARSPRPPFAVTRHWLGLLDGSVDDPLRRQAFPSGAEYLHDESELSDPLGEDKHSRLPRLIHRYPDRALVVVTGVCALYCRHCFRRRLSGEDSGTISHHQADAIAGWLASHTEVRELLLSGGDPLTLSNRRILGLIDRFREARPDIVLRLATRIPIVEPDRITRTLARALGRRRPLWMVLQTNHPRELAPSALGAINRLQTRGLPIINQAVLLRGVNDNIETLEELSRSLVSAGVKPYYLFQGDLATGTGHFRLPLDEARTLVERLRSRVSGLAMPVFAVDLPGGGGKVPLGVDHVLGREEDGWRLRSPDGTEGIYPDIEPAKEQP